jgi:hypothetical protein
MEDYLEKPGCEDAVNMRDVYVEVGTDRFTQQVRVHSMYRHNFSIC